MTQWMRGLAVVAAVALLSGPALAQATKPKPPEPDTKKPDDKKGTDDKKADPKKPGDKADPKAAAKGTVAVKPDAKGKFRLYVRDEDGKTLLMSASGYDSAADAKKALDDIKTILESSKVTEEKADAKKDGDKPKTPEKSKDGDKPTEKGK